MPSIHPTASSDVVFISPKCQGVTKDWFKPEYWQEQNRLSHTATGRGTVWFIDSPLGALVLRKYRRGGFIAKFNRNKFLTKPLKSTRPYTELALLESLQDFSLPAPQPVAGMVRREGLFYEAWLLTKVIPNAQDLYTVLQERALAPDIWQKIGRVIRQFHDRNVFHSDLNCHNIMLNDTQQIWLIDFDKCTIGSQQKNWKQQNLNRLKRSFDKELAQLANFAFDETSWQQLLSGYHG